ncbi:MAG TPA: RNA repair transcriptional activator RtcR family protein, partial [Bacillota bacterium]|nr:RNA repair transcriptional activator RtcR family protein [Bacillota bacterium]
MQRPTVIIGLLGSVLDAGFHQQRWEKWRPTVSLCQHPDLPVARFELIHLKVHEDIARCVAADIQRLCPGTAVRLHLQEL